MSGADVHAEGRIARLSVDDARAAATGLGLMQNVAELSIFQVLLRHPRLAKATNDWLGQLLLRGSLDGRLRELMIMRIGWQTNSYYEWTQHWSISQNFGCTEDELLGVRDWQHHDAFGPAERAVLAAVDEALSDGAVSAATWAELEQHTGSVEALLEVPLVIGGWAMISKFLRSVEVPLEDGVDPWPPAGEGPR
jgi:alkylhydroperoxidase family enzyme